MFSAPGTDSGALRLTVRQRVQLPLAACARVPECVSFSGLAPGDEPVALVFGPLSASQPVPVRLHSECLTGDVFGSQRCDCGPQLQEALQQLDAEGGVLLYLRQEGRGIGLYAKLDAYQLQQQGLDTFAANRALGWAEDARDYRSAAAMLQALGIAAVHLISNNPDKARALAAHGVSVASVRPTGLHLTPHNKGYLQAKKNQHGHHLAALLADAG